MTHEDLDFDEDENLLNDDFEIMQDKLEKSQQIEMNLKLIIKEVE